MKAEVERLFHKLADLSLDERAAYWKEQPVDEDTRREVESLLAFDPGDAITEKHRMNMRLLKKLTTRRPLSFDW